MNQWSYNRKTDDIQNLNESKRTAFYPLITAVGCLVFAWLLYLPVFHHYFISDDFKVLHRVCQERVLFIQRFFRPLSDFSILFNYYVGGLNPFIYNFFNITIHGINAYLLWQFSLRFGKKLELNQPNGFAWMTTLIFICYPFHNEAVVWMLGRGASLACMFALFSLLSSFFNVRENIRIFLACFFYFIGLSAFESIIFLPFIYVIVLYAKKHSRQSIVKWAAALFITLVVHLILRLKISGSLTGSYGGEFFHGSLTQYVGHVIKVIGRLLLPPSQSALIITSGFCLLTFCFTVFIYKKRQEFIQTKIGRLGILLILMLLISCIVPFVTGLSTQTSETDRMLYFPSLFLSMVVSLFLNCFFKKTRLRLVLFCLILIYQVILLEFNNQNWIKASEVTKSILSKATEFSRDNSKGKIYFLNIPDEINGAFVFRQGFSDALKLLNLDSSRVIPVNYLPRQDLQLMTKKFVPDTLLPDLGLPPNIILKKNQSFCRDIFDHGIFAFRTFSDDKIFYWNVNNLDSIPVSMQ